MNSKIVVCSLAVALLICGGNALAHPGFNSLMGCFAYVHDGCYLNTDSPCSEEDYNVLLDGCYGHFPTQNAKPRPTNK